MNPERRIMLYYFMNHKKETICTFDGWAWHFDKPLPKEDAEAFALLMASIKKSEEKEEAVPISFAIERSTIDALDLVVTRTGQNRSSLVRKFVKDGLIKYEEVCNN